MTLSTPFSLSSSGRGVQATRYLYETEGGFGTAINTAAETALGVKLEDLAQLGEDLDPDTVFDAITDQLLQDSTGWAELEVGVPDHVVPYTHMGLGDRVLCQSEADGAAVPMRVVGLRCEVTDDTGHPEWVAQLEPAE